MTIEVKRSKFYLPKVDVVLGVTFVIGIGFVFIADMRTTRANTEQLRASHPLGTTVRIGEVGIQGVVLDYKKDIILVLVPAVGIIEVPTSALRTEKSPSNN